MPVILVVFLAVVFIIMILIVDLYRCLRMLKPLDRPNELPEVCTICKEYEYNCPDCPHDKSRWF